MRVRGTKSQQLELFKKLDASHRLGLVDSSLVHGRPRNGLFSVYKNQDKDRLVLDGRPPNLFEIGLKVWTLFMAIIVPMLGMYIPDGFLAFLYADDLVDYYYEYIVSF